MGSCLPIPEPADAAAGHHCHYEDANIRFDTFNDAKLALLEALFSIITCLGVVMETTNDAHTRERLREIRDSLTDLEIHADHFSLSDVESDDASDDPSEGA